MHQSFSIGADATMDMGTPNPNFFRSKEEAWMYVENIKDDFYDMMHKINRDSAALAYIGEGTGDIESIRYLMHKAWKHLCERSDALFDVYHDSDEYSKPHSDQVVLDDFDKKNNTTQ